MSDPLQRFKALPWREMFETSALTNAGLIIVELVLGSFIRSSVGERIFRLVFTSPISILIPVLVSIGMGALAISIFELRKQQYLLNRSSMWALVLCLLLGFLVKLLLPLRPLLLLVSLSETTLFGIAIGVFWKGRPYWRWG